MGWRPRVARARVARVKRGIQGRLGDDSGPRLPVAAYLREESVDIGRPKRIIEVEPQVLPVPETLPAPAPGPAPVEPTVPAPSSPVEAPER